MDIRDDMNRSTKNDKVPESLQDDKLHDDRRDGQIDGAPSLSLSIYPKLVGHAPSLPNRSPFRYPGGKTSLIPGFRLWLKSLNFRPRRIIEPFAGGGTISLTAVFENLVDSALMIELDPNVAAFWNTVLRSEAGKNWLVKRILTFDVTAESVALELSELPVSRREIAFKTFLRNRTNMGGLMTKDSGRLKNGERGKGVKSRWYAETLAQRVRDIAARRDKIQFAKGDGMKVVRSHSAETDVIWFIDPPYTAGGKNAGRTLYSHHGLNHTKLFKHVAKLAGPWLMTYDNCIEVRELAAKYAFDTEPISIRNTGHKETTELLISRDLTWARNMSATVCQTPSTNSEL